MRYPVRASGSIDDVFRPDPVPVRQGHLPSSIVWSEVPRYRDGGDAVFDLEHLRTLLGYPFRAARRRRRAALGVFLVVIALTALAALILPRSYLIESRILAQRNVVMPMLGNPKRSIPAESDAPTRLAAEAVLSRDNLLSIVRSTDLLRAWPSIVSPAGRVRARIAEAISGAPSDSERVDALVGLLKQRLWVVS